MPLGLPKFAPIKWARPAFLRTEFWRRLAQRTIMLRTVTFRLALVQVGLFAGFSLALLGFVYYATVVQTQSEADAVVDQEFNELANIYQKDGMNALNQEVFERASGDGPQLYVLADPRGDIVAGDFRAFPQLPASGSQRVPFEYKTNGPDGKPEVNRARGRIGRIYGGPILMVARDMASSSVLVRRVTSAVNFGAAFGLILSLISGYFASRQAARRAEALSRTAKDVMRGDLTRRAPVVGANDEFDTLAQDLNAMLDRIERLMRSARTAGDAIAHDLRTPLTRLRSRLEAAIESPPNEDADREALRRALEETDSVLATFTAVLRLARVQSAAGWQFQRVDLSAIARDLVEFYEPVAEDGGVSFSSEIDDDLVAPGEASLMTQALSNLIENAIKYTPAPGRVHVSAKRGDRIVLSVADTGPGVPPEERERVIDRFVRLETARSTPGAGLGLSLVAAVAEVHHAELKLEDGLGGATPGLRVTLTLPVLAAKG
jgi:signal transduction histidine kinase